MNTLPGFSGACLWLGIIRLANFPGLEFPALDDASYLIIRQNFGLIEASDRGRNPVKSKPVD
jgi:hypothetical protein